MDAVGGDKPFIALMISALDKLLMHTEMTPSGKAPRGDMGRGMAGLMRLSDIRHERRRQAIEWGAESYIKMTRRRAPLISYIISDSGALLIKAKSTRRPLCNARYFITKSLPDLPSLMSIIYWRLSNSS